MPGPNPPVTHIALTVRRGEFDKVSEFYQEVFGWQKAREIDGPWGPVMWLTDRQGFQLELLSRDEVDRPGTQSLGHFCVSVPDEEFDAFVERLHNFGIEADEPKAHSREDLGDLDEEAAIYAAGRFTFFADPSGNRIELSSRSVSL